MWESIPPAVRMNPSPAIASVVAPTTMCGDTPPGALDARHGVCFAGFEAHRSARGNIQPASPRRVAIEIERAIGFREVVMAADLDGPIAPVGDLQVDCVAALIDHNVGGGGE